MIIDFHTHTFPPKLAETAIPMMSEVSGITPALNGTAADLLVSMKEQSIDYSVLMPVATKTTQVPKLNTVALLANGVDNLYTFGAMHPHYEDIRGELKRLADGGIKGIKLHFDYVKIFVDAEESVSVINEAFDCGLAVLIHAGFDPISPDVSYSHVERIARILPKLTKGTFILAHYGGLKQLDYVSRLLVGKDVYLDCSVSHEYAPLEQCKDILLRHDPDKLLYGSDSPWFAQRSTYETLLKMELPESLMNKICYENAARILGFDAL